MQSPLSREQELEHQGFFSLAKHERKNICPVLHIPETGGIQKDLDCIIGKKNPYLWKFCDSVYKNKFLLVFLVAEIMVFCFTVIQNLF